MYTAYNENNFLNDLSLDYDVEFVMFSKLGECVMRYTDKNEQTKETTVKFFNDYFSFYIINTETA